MDITLPVGMVTLLVAIATVLPVHSSALTKNWGKLMTEGQDALSKHDATLAESRFASAAQMSEHNGFLHRVSQYHLATALQAEGKYGDAIRLYTADINSRRFRDTASISSVFGAANCYARLGKWDKAEKLYLQCLSLFTGPGRVRNAWPDKADVIVASMRFYLSCGQFEKMRLMSGQLDDYVGQLPPNKVIMRCLALCAQLRELQDTAPPQQRKPCQQLLEALTERLADRAQAKQKLTPHMVMVGGHRIQRATDTQAILMLQYSLLEQYRVSDPARYLRDVEPLIRQLQAAPDCKDSLIMVKALKDRARTHVMCKMHKESLKSLTVACEAIEKIPNEAPERASLLVALIRELHMANETERGNNVLTELSQLTERTISGAHWLSLGNEEAGLNSPLDRRIANVCYTQAIAARPHDWEAYQARSSNNQALGRSQAALIDNDAALHYGGQNKPDAWTMRASIMMDMGRLDEAAEAAAKSLRLSNTPGGHITLGHIYSSQRKFPLAVQEYSKALQMDPTIDNVYVSRANANILRGATSEALQDYNRAIELSPEQCDFFLARASFFAGCGRIEEALKDYKKASDLAPNRPEPLVARGLGFWQLSHYEDALRSFQKAVSLGTRNSDCFAGMGHCYSGLHQYDNAVDAYKKAIAINPKSFNAYWGLAGVYCALKEKSKAAACLTTAIKLQPNNPGVYADRARVRMGSGDTAGAHQDCDTALSLSGNDNKMRKTCEEILGAKL